MLITSFLIFKMLLLNNISAEWIDMPQFSDEKKVYRTPIIKQDHFYKFTPKNVDNQFLYTYQNISYKDEKTDRAAANKNGEYDFYKNNNNKNQPAISKFVDKENIFVTDTEKYNESTISLMIKKEEKNKQYSNEPFILNDIELLNYLPVDVLKSVHCTLKSQPTSSEGKVQFLKTFENTLIAEIEFRLAENIISVRKKRGVEHYDHNYDHEHAAGFPSIEGALMAISFLTFAVYLVRLVMLLFRNMNNSAMTTTGATLLLGRRKKSINKLDDDTTMVLKSLHSFSSKF